MRLGQPRIPGKAELETDRCREGRSWRTSHPREKGEDVVGSE